MLDKVDTVIKDKLESDRISNKTVFYHTYIDQVEYVCCYNKHIEDFTFLTMKQLERLHMSVGQ